MDDHPRGFINNRGTCSERGPGRSGEATFLHPTQDINLISMNDVVLDSKGLKELR